MVKLHTDSTLVETARALGPTIREYAKQSEQQRRLARPVLDALAGSGLLRMYLPRSLGGLEVDPITCARVVEEVSGFDSAAGWALMVANSMAWWCARLPEAGADEIYSRSPNAVIAAAFHPPMQATEAPAGYRVSGRSPLASNIHDANWLFVAALVMDGDHPKMTSGAPEVVGAILPTAECEVFDTWYSLGMRGTDSNDVGVNGVYIPAARSFRLVPTFEPGLHYQGTLYRAPAMGPALAVWAPVALAIARSAIDELCALAEQKTPFSSATTLRERASAQAKVGQAEAILQSARVLLYDPLAETWERTLTGETSTLKQKTKLLMAAVHAVDSAARVTELMYTAAGSSAIYVRSPLERHFRDAHVLKQHGFLSESRYETVGQVRFGLNPDLGLVTF